MKVYRFMSLKEFCGVISGKDVIKRKPFPNCPTKSHGISFTDNPQEIIKMSGVIGNGVLVEFECDPKDLTESSGVSLDETKKEYYASSYNNKVFKPLRYAPTAHFLSPLDYQFTWFEISSFELLPPKGSRIKDIVYAL